METVLIAGGTGLIGEALTDALIVKGYRVIVLSRKKHKSMRRGLDYAVWNVKESTIEREAIETADHIVNLAGANLAEGRWTKNRKKELEDSRVQSGQLIVKALEEIPNNVKTVVSASGIGYYGSDDVIPNTNPYREDKQPGDDFLASLCVKWEQAIQPVMELGKRLVILRSGIVLSQKGGAYKEFRMPFKFRVAPVLGSGKQMVSWIHIDDIVRLYIDVIENKNYHGAYNAVAPEPVSNKRLMKAIAQTLHGPFIFFPVPAFSLRVALGEMSVEVLKSNTVSSEKVQEAGFKFHYPTIKAAVKQLEQ
jgi:uncharacterized protein (TIGR01777 family)